MRKTAPKAPTKLHLDRQTIRALRPELVSVTGGMPVTIYFNCMTSGVCG